MKITYIHHSSFLVELKSVMLLFDYFEGELPVLNRKKPLYVFASHRHWDHFSEVIYGLSESHPEVHYILSKDILKSQVPEACRDKTLFMGKNEEEKAGEAEIRTFRSTDKGVAFLVRADGKAIYHGGDLNDWTWLDGKEEWNLKMRRVYRRVVDGMKDLEIDAAFLPLDGRQQEAYYQGLHYFLSQVKQVKAVFPMHFWMDYEIIRRLKSMPESVDYRDRIYEITHEGQEFLL